MCFCMCAEHFIVNNYKEHMHERENNNLSPRYKASVESEALTWKILWEGGRKGVSAIELPKGGNLIEKLLL